MLSLGALSLGAPAIRASGTSLDCKGVKVCGLLTLESGLGQGNYKHPQPGARRPHN